MQCDRLWKNARLATLTGDGPGIVEDGLLAAREGRIVFAGAVTDAPSLDAALQLVRLPPPAFCIGGAELYRFALPQADRLEITEIAADFAGDTRFPDYDRRCWIEASRRPGAPEAADGPVYSFASYRRAR